MPRWITAITLRSRFGGDEGSVAIEFAFIGSLCLTMLIAAMQLGLYFYTLASLERVTATAMRQVLTGAAGSGSMTSTQFRTDILCPLLPALMQCANVVTNIATVSPGASPTGFYQFVNSAQSWVTTPLMNNSQTSFCTGSSGSVVYAQIYYAMPIIFGNVFGPISTWNGHSVYFVGAFAAFKSEPYQGSSSNC